jgi:surface antigen
MDKNQTLADLLRNLSLRADDADRQRIEEALNDVRISVLALSSTTRHGTRLTHIPLQLDNDLVSQGTSSARRSGEKRSHKTVTSDEDKETGSLGEAHVGGSIGSNEELDHLDENLMRSADTRAAGYYGKNSDVQWLNSVQRQTEHMGAELRDQPYGPPGSSSKSIRARSDALHERRKNAGAQTEQSSIKDSTFYLDNEDIHLGFVNPTEQPEPETAERLFGYYIKTVHSSYPLVSTCSSIVTYHEGY